MKKFTLIFSIIALSISAAFSQPAPDFTATDINGNTHTLYDYLNDGKVVILDVSATWCGPCWALHQNHYLEYLNSTFGPDGTDEVVVIFYEGDTSTGSDELNGISGNTLGDWVTGVSYIIIDETDAAAVNAINNVYAPQGFPTVNVICPSTKTIIADVYNQNLPGMISAINGCAATNLSMVADLYMGNSKDNAICVQGELYGHVVNTGTEPYTSFTVEAKDAMGNLVGSGTFSGNLTTGQSADVSIGVVNAPLVPETYTFEVAGANDPNTHNNQRDEEITAASATTSAIMVSIDADQYVVDDPTTWRIEDENGTVVVQGPALVNSTLFEDTYYLQASGCYEFIIEDGYGDGNSGAIQITDSDGIVIYDNSGFGSKGVGKFEVNQIVGNNDFENIGAFDLQSNMVSNQLVVAITNKQPADNQSIAIANLLGQVLFTKSLEKNTKEHEISIDVNQLNPGFYFAVLNTNGKAISKKFTKQ